VKWPWMRLKFVTAVPIRNGLGEPGIQKNPNWPRYIRTTDIAGPRSLRTDVFASLPPDIAVQASVRPGDILLSAAGSVGKSLLYLSHEPACYAGYLVLVRPKPDVDSRYLAYWTESPLFLDQVETGKVTSTIDNFSAGKYRDLAVPLPPISAQRAIADYLDRETARIDALIEKKQRMLELLEERLQVEVDLATVPGDEPLVSLRRYVSDACDGPFGSALKSEHYTESGARVIRLGNIGRASWRDGDVARIPFGYWAELEHHHAQAGDVVIAGLGDEGNPVGRACVLPELGPALVKADCYRLRLREGAADGVYLAWYLSSRRGLANAERMAEGSTRPRLTLAKALSLPIPLLTVDRQHAIARCLVDQFARFEAVKKPLSSQIALLQEHRQALITAAVTGELEIPGVAA